MTRSTFYIGLNDKDTKTQLIDTQTAMTKVSQACIDIFGGASIQPLTGIYTHGIGQTITERTLKVEVMEIPKKDNIENDNQIFISRMKRELNQESILVVVEDIVAAYV